MNRIPYIICLLVSAVANLLSQQNDFPKLNGPYLGQKPPGMSPEIFAPGLISSESRSECCRAISPDGREFFFVRKLESGDKIFRMTEGENGWTKPELITYTDKAFQYTPFISPGIDNNLLFGRAGRVSISGPVCRFNHREG